ncbi:MAG: hypothetical protein HIU84_08185 [Acidobacteria bacterium]|nr:hypothetical protein [Acidobacteriota bacterium]
MPSPKPSPRRASSAGRPPAGGRGSGSRSGGFSSSKGGSDRSGGDRFSTSPRSARPARDGAERRIERNSGDTGTPRRPRRDDERAREDRAPFTRRPDDRDERRPRPSPDARGRQSGRAERPYASRDVRSSTARDGRPARPYASRDGRPARPYANRDERTRDARPGATRGERPDQSERYQDRRPSLAPRGARPGASNRTGQARPYPRTPRPLTPEELERKKAESHGRGKGWGGVARKGAASIKSTGQAMEVTPSDGRTPDPLSQWVEEVRPTRSAPAAKVKNKVKYALPGDVAADVRKAFIGSAYMREKMVITLTRAAEAYDRKRYEEALRLGRTVCDAVPGVAPVRELTGLAAYRAERWAMAKIHLRAHFAITGDPEHLALVMDCDRANHRYRAVEKTFEELEASEPTAEVLAEGRIVMASALADQLKYAEAIALLTKAGATKQLRNPSYRHVRLWYTLADVFDRAGDVTSARELFARVVIAEPDAYDAQARLNELGSTAPRKNRKRRTTSVSKKKVD